VDVQITAIVGWGGGGVAWAWLYLITLLQKKQTATQLYC